jgi:alanine dehydrogenase
VLVPGASAPRLLTRPMLGMMKPGAVLVDVAIDQGGCFETSRATTHADPTYEVDGIVHYCVANMPGAVPLTSSHALNNATLPYGLALASLGLDALREDAGLREGLNIHRGRITNRAVG